jgi:hypothetical protein
MELVRRVDRDAEVEADHGPCAALDDVDEAARPAPGVDHDLPGEGLRGPARVALHARREDVGAVQAVVLRACPARPLAAERVGVLLVVDEAGDAAPDRIAASARGAGEAPLFHRIAPVRIERELAAALRAHEDPRRVAPHAHYLTRRGGRP